MELSRSQPKEHPSPETTLMALKDSTQRASGVTVYVEWLEDGSVRAAVRLAQSRVSSLRRRMCS
jgi:hypothetical protein